MHWIVLVCCVCVLYLCTVVCTLGYVFTIVLFWICAYVCLYVQFVCLRCEFVNVLLLLMWVVVLLCTCCVCVGYVCWLCGCFCTCVCVLYECCVCVGGRLSPLQDQSEAEWRLLSYQTRTLWWLSGSEGRWEGNIKWETGLGGREATMTRWVWKVMMEGNSKVEIGKVWATRLWRKLKKNRIGVRTFSVQLGPFLGSLIEDMDNVWTDKCTV